VSALLAALLVPLIAYAAQSGPWPAPRVPEGRPRSLRERGLTAVSPRACGSRAPRCWRVCRSATPGPGPTFC